MRRLAVAGSIAAVAVIAACKRDAGAGGGAASVSASPAPALTPLAIPHRQGEIELDGELEEATWRDQGPARTGPFPDVEHGGVARPYSEARIVWDESNLYLGLYAADENELGTGKHDALAPGDDFFEVRIGGGDGKMRTIDVNPMGTVADRLDSDASWESGIALAVDHDGTVNDTHDQDEEWVVESKIPWRTLSIRPADGTRVGLDVRRCDTPLDGKTGCGTWGRDADGRMVGSLTLKK